MKSLTAVCQTGASSMPPMNSNGRIGRHPPHRGDGENAEMKMYLSKLKDLVPFMPKNRKLSKLEIIQHVIDYICDLQTELEAHPEIGNFDAATALSMATDDSAVDTEATTTTENGGNSEENERFLAERLAGALSQHQQHLLQQQQQQNASSSPAQRQPLADRQAPNTILPAHTTMAMHMQQQLQMQQQQWEQEQLQLQQQQQQQSQQPSQQQQQQQQTPAASEAVSC